MLDLLMKYTKKVTYFLGIFPQKYTKNKPNKSNVLNCLTELIH